MFYAAGVGCAILALWRSRTPQGTTAWVIALLSFPFLAVPVFIVFGRNRFVGYVKERKEYDRSARKELEEIETIFAKGLSSPLRLKPLDKLVSQTLQPGFLPHNKAELLLNGEKTFESMVEAVDGAEKYILIQFYIFRPDDLGLKLIERLIKKSEQGVRVYLLCDKIGSKFPRKLRRRIQEAGIKFSYFFSTKSWLHHFQINFRNHRKNLVIDGKTAFVGGLNVGDDYLGKYPHVGFWRDTHLKVVGPSALSAQLSFLKDWYWTQDEFLDLEWDSENDEDGVGVLVFHSGPSDEVEACSLAHIQLINAAQKRIWLATPYFVPPQGLVDALALAVLRGVDVRILVPARNDNFLVQLASEVFMENLLHVGVRFFKYNKGFLHQKVMLIDEDLSVVGSANMDYRSFFLNFEITAVVEDSVLAKQVEKSFGEDFLNSCEITYEECLRRPFAAQIVSRAASLLAPML